MLSLCLFLVTVVSGQLQPCEPGHQLSKDSCDPCPLGQFSSNGGPCVPCVPGTFTSAIGSSFCLDCEQESQSPFKKVFCQQALIEVETARQPEVVIPILDFLHPAQGGLVHMRMSRSNPSGPTAIARSTQVFLPGTYTFSFTSTINGDYSPPPTAALDPSAVCAEGAELQLRSYPAVTSWFGHSLIAKRTGKVEGEITVTAVANITLLSYLEIAMTCRLGWNASISLLTTNGSADLSFVPFKNAILDFVITRPPHTPDGAQAKHENLVPPGTYALSFTSLFEGDYSFKSAECPEGSEIIVALGSKVVAARNTEDSDPASLEKVTGEATISTPTPLFVNLTCDSGWSAIFTEFRFAAIRCSLPHQRRVSALGKCVDYSWPVTIKSVEFDRYWDTNATIVTLRSSSNHIGKIALIREGEFYAIKNEAGKILVADSTHNCHFVSVGTPSLFSGQWKIEYADSTSLELLIYGLSHGNTRAYLVPNQNGTRLRVQDAGVDMSKATWILSH